MADVRKKLILTYVDSLRSDMLWRAIDDGRAPNFGALVEPAASGEALAQARPASTRAKSQGALPLEPHQRRSL